MNKKYIIRVTYPGELSKAVVREYADTVKDEDILEDTFAEWNSGSLRECPEFIRGKFRSLSVGDFVSINTRVYQVESMGFSRRSECYLIDYERDVFNHPNFKECGAYYASNSLQWERKCDIMATEGELDRG